MDTYSKSRVVNFKRCDKRNDTSSQRETLSTILLCFHFYFCWVIVDQDGLGSGVGINTRNNQLFAGPGSCFDVTRMQGRCCRQRATARYEDDTCNYDFTIVSIDPSFFPFSNIDAASHADTHASYPSSCVLICASAIIQSVERTLLKYSCFRFQEASGEDS